MALRRKRTAEVLSPSPDLILRDSSPNKHSKTFSDIDEVALIPASEAYTFDNSSLLDSGLPPPAVHIIVVMERLRVHYDLLKSHLDNILSLDLSPNSIQATLLAHPDDLPLASCDLIPFLPLHSGITPNANHFSRLGLLHPLGGGQTALDALVLLDGGRRRRLVLPFGWGAGRHVLDEAGGRMVSEELMKTFVEGVRTLAEESGAGKGTGTVLDGGAMEM